MGSFSYQHQQAGLTLAHVRIARERLLAEVTAECEGPTTVCTACDRIFPAMEAYKSRKDDRLICPVCFNRAQEGGRARLVDTSPTEEASYGNFPPKHGS